MLLSFRFYAGFRGTQCILKRLLPNSGPIIVHLIHRYLPPTTGSSSGSLRAISNPVAQLALLYIHNNRDFPIPRDLKVSGIG
jgi:hypothetical protein